MGRKPLPEIRLSAEEYIQLIELIRSDVKQAKVKTRAWVLLMADELDENDHGEIHHRMDSHRAIAEALQITWRTVTRVRERFLNGGLEEALYDKIRPGRPIKIDGEAEPILTTKIQLSTEERRYLEVLISNDVSRVRVKTRARILLRASERGFCIRGERRSKTNSIRAIAEALQISESMVVQVLKRFLSGGLERALYEKPAIRASVKIDSEAEAKLVNLACSAPPTGHKRWTLQLLADRMVELGYVEHISDTWVSMILKKANCSYRPSKRPHYMPSRNAVKAKLIMLDCSEPPIGHKRWTQQLLADRLIELGYVDQISESWIGMVIKEVELKLIMLASSAPPEGYERWTLKLLADRMVELGYVDSFSDTWVSVILKKAKFDYRSSNKKAGLE